MITLATMFGFWVTWKERYNEGFWSIVTVLTCFSIAYYIIENGLGRF